MAIDKNAIYSLTNTNGGKVYPETIADAVNYDSTTTVKGKLNVLDERMSTFTNLPTGSTSGDAELQDIRVKVDGKSASSAGAAVREQITSVMNDCKDRYDEVKNEIEEIGAYRPNEFNKNDITLGKYPNSSLGQTINSFIEKENSFICNQRWRVKPGDIIRWTWPYASFYIYNDKNILIEKLGSDGKCEAIIQNNDAYIMVYLNTSSVGDNYINNFMFTINRDLPTEYVPYSYIGIDTYNDKVLNDKLNKITNTNHIPYIILNFDNQIESLNDNVVLLLEKYGFKGSFVGWEHPSVFIELLKRGWDIGTYDNSSDILPSSSIIDSKTESDIALYDNYVQKAQEKQSNVGIYNPTIWCSRQNKWGSALAHGVKKYGYKMARAYQTGDVYNLNYNTEFPVFDSQRFYTEDLNTVKSVINTASNTKNSIVIILAHKLIDSSDADRGYDCLAAVYENMLIYLKEKVNAGLVKVLTYRELYKALYPDEAYENDYNRLLKMSNFKYN